MASTTLSPEQIVSRSNSDALTIEMIVNDRDLSPLVRLALIEEVVTGWAQNVGTIRARKDVEDGVQSVAKYLKFRADHAEQANAEVGA